MAIHRRKDAGTLIERVTSISTSKVPQKKRYLDEIPGQAAADIWADISPINSQAKERVGYPTQKPLDLLDRIIKASSNEKGIVLDPFCGCATTCISAQGLGRHWSGIDISPKAADLVQQRMRDELDLFCQGHPPNGYSQTNGPGNDP